MGLKRVDAKTGDIKVDTETQSVVNKLALQVMNIMERDSATQKEFIEFKYRSKEDRGKLEAELEVRNKEQSNLQRDVAALTKRIDELEKQVHTLTKQRDAERAEKEQVIAEKEALEKEKRELEERIERLEAEKRELEGSIEEKSVKIEELDKSDSEVQNGDGDSGPGADDLHPISGAGSNS